MFEVRALDPAGHQGPAALVRFRVDTLPPLPTFLHLTTADPTPVLAGQAHDDGSGVAYVVVEVDGQGSRRH